jgi:hypothetical protein
MLHHICLKKSTGESKNNDVLSTVVLFSYSFLNDAVVSAKVCVFAYWFNNAASTTRHRTSNENRHDASW